MSTEIKIEFCAVCGSKEIEVTGNKLYCRECDITYKVTKAGATAVDTNPLGKQNARLDQAEKDIADLKGQKPAAPDSETGPVVDDPVETEDEAEEQDGFITFE